MTRLHTSITGLLLTLGIALAACGSSEGSGHGVVRGVDREHAQVTLEHGDIEGVMKGMTMTFAVEDPQLLEGLETGEAVDFRVLYRDGGYVVTSIEPR